MLRQVRAPLKAAVKMGDSQPVQLPGGLFEAQPQALLARPRELVALERQIQRDLAPYVDLRPIRCPTAIEGVVPPQQRRRVTML